MGPQFPDGLTKHQTSFLGVMGSRWVAHRSDCHRQLAGDIFRWLVPRRRHGGTRGNLPETGSCSAPSRPNAPEGAPAARLVPQWHVTNGDMFLLPCLVRSEAPIEDNAEGIAQIHMSAARTPARQKPPRGTNENKLISFQRKRVQFSAIMGLVEMIICASILFTYG